VIWSRWSGSNRRPAVYELPPRRPGASPSVRSDLATSRCRPHAALRVRRNTRASESHDESHGAPPVGRSQEIGRQRKLSAVAVTTAVTVQTEGAKRAERIGQFLPARRVPGRSAPRATAASGCRKKRGGHDPPLLDGPDNAVAREASPCGRRPDGTSPSVLTRLLRRSYTRRVIVSEGFFPDLLCWKEGAVSR
jgi:hypothetical protein